MTTKRLRTAVLLLGLGVALPSRADGPTQAGPAEETVQALAFLDQADRAEGTLRALIAEAVKQCAAIAGEARAETPDLQLAVPYSISVYNDGPGIRLGRAPLLVHPGAALEFGYDSNVLYDHVAVPAAVMRLRLHADLTTLDLGTRA